MALTRAEAPAVVIGSSDGEHLRITARQAHPEATSPSDRDWLVGWVEIAAGGFRAAFQAWFESADFARLQSGLRRLDRELSGVAEFATWEEQLTLTFEGDGRGHIEVRGVAVDRAGGGNRLEFILRLDQTELPAILAGLDSFVARPSRGWTGLLGR